MNKEHENKLKNNDEVGFLYKKCKKIRPSVISMLVFVPEYMNAIKKYTGYINDEVLFEILRKEFKTMCENGTAYRTARGIMNKISKDVKGDSSFWETEN